MYVEIKFILYVVYIVDFLGVLQPCVYVWLWPYLYMYSTHVAISFQQRWLSL